MASPQRDRLRISPQRDGRGLKAANEIEEHQCLTFAMEKNENFMHIVSASDPSFSCDPLLVEAASGRLNIVGDGQRPGESIKNFIVGDSKVLVIYAGGVIGLRKSSDRGAGYFPSKGNLAEVIRHCNMLHDPAFDQTSGDIDTDFVTPLSSYGKRVHFDIRECDPLMDSGCADMADWAKLCEDIVESYDRYDGFVVLHGADTMAYAASGLSFMLCNLGKTVVFTGATLPLCEPRSDGLGHLVDSLTIAGHFIIPEVCVFYGKKLMRGNRVTKVSACGFEPFDSPNADVLASAGPFIEIHWKNIHQPLAVSPLEIQCNLCPDVAVLHLFPGITTSAVRSLLGPSIRGVVIRSFGAGNTPITRHDILSTLKKACDRGVVIVNTTQCTRGGVLGDGDRSRLLTKFGVVCGADMTLECCVAKLAYLLGTNSTTDRVKQLLGTNIRGELTAPVTDKIIADTQNFIERMSRVLDLASESEGEKVKKYMNGMLLCNLAQSGDLSTMKRLVDLADWDVDVQDYDARTPLHLAAARGHVEMVSYLLTKGARVHVKDHTGFTPLLQAVVAHQGEAAALIAKGGGTFGLSDTKLSQIMCQGVMDRDYDMLQLFIKHGANMQAADYNRTTPLTVAIAQGSLDIVRLLVDSKLCDLSTRDWWGYTPLQMAQEARTRSYESDCDTYTKICEILEKETTVEEVSLAESVTEGEYIDT
eukprot:Sspe_Gene.52504::Locus_29085_Transcript_1_1_Confidence_1.000_Length_2446::g.52504::m.52504/K13278/ASPG; 60kDa lysophospholipase